MKLLSCLRTALCLLGLLAMPAAAAYPEKPINMIIAFTAGRFERRAGSDYAEVLE